MTKLYIPFLILASTLVFSSSVFSATEIKKRSGQLIKGEILYEESDGLYMETTSGVVNVKKSDIAELNGKPYGIEPPEAQVNDPAPPSNSNQSGTVIKVGGFTLSQSELNIYLNHLLDPQRHTNLSGLDWGVTNIQLRKAIEDEIVFQEALRIGIHKKEPTRTNIIELYKASQTIVSINPNEFKESEMRSFYEKNKKEFMQPAKYVFQLLSITENPQATYMQAKSDPQSIAGWKKGGWIEEGDTFHLPLSEAQEKMIYKLRKDQISEIITDGMGQAYLFWCVDYKAPVQKTFEQARDRIKHLMIEQQKVTNEKTLSTRIKKESNASTEEAFFVEAIKTGTHRDRHIRDQIINYYLSGTGKTLGAVVLEAKNRYAIEIE